MHIGDSDTTGTIGGMWFGINNPQLVKKYFYKNFEYKYLLKYLSKKIFTKYF